MLQRPDEPAVEVYIQLRLTWRQIGILKIKKTKLNDVINLDIIRHVCNNIIHIINNFKIEELLKKLSYFHTCFCLIKKDFNEKNRNNL